LLYSLFLKNHVFGDFLGWGENEGRNNNMLASPEYWFKILLDRFFGVGEACKKSAKLIRCQK